MERIEKVTLLLSLVEHDELSVRLTDRFRSLLVTAKAEGTAYLVHSCYLITSASLVAGVGIGGVVDVVLRAPNSQVQAKVRQLDLRHDWALLELLAGGLDRGPLLSLSTTATENRWVALGYPHSAEPEGLFLAGDVRGTGGIAAGDLEMIHFDGQPLDCRSRIF